MADPQHPVQNQQVLGDVDEFEIIDLITRGIRPDPAVLLGPGDDAAVVAIPSGRLVISTDTLVEGVHFRRDWSSAIEVGRKAVAVSVADLEAMGARPVGMLIGFSAPAELPLTWVRFLVQGLHQEIEQAGLVLVGGDLTAGRDITLAMTVLGEAERPVTRSGARPGDVIAIRGRLGWAAAGWAVLGRGFRSPRKVVEAQLVPQVPYGAGAQAQAAGAHAMIDVSDGLLADLGHLAQASQVAIDLRSAAFEIAEPLQAVGAATGTDPLGFVLTGGEDHALAAAFAEGDPPPDWTVVGRVAEGPAAVTVDGEVWAGDPGFRHFGG